MGSKSSPSVPVCSHNPDAVPIDSSVHQILKCGPPRLRWTTSSSATTTRVHDMAWLAGRPGGILIMWPAIRSHLSATTLITALILSKVDFYNVGLAESWPWASTVGHQCCCSVLRLERVNSTNCCISIVTWQLYSLSSSTAHRSGTITRAQTEQLESIQKRAMRIIFPSLVKFPTDTHYLLQISTLCILESRRHDISKAFFQDMRDPSSCIHHLLPPHATLLFYPGSEQSHLSHA